jgi:excisionase family DNA binding protein
VTNNHHSKVGSKINLTIKRETSDVRASGRSHQAQVAPCGKVSSCDKLEPLAVSVGEAARLAGVSRTMLYQALRSGGLRSLKIGSRRLITIEALDAWLHLHAVDS